MLSDLSIGTFGQFTWRCPVAYLLTCMVVLPALLALYFATYFYARYPAIYLLPGFLVGFTFAFGQEARGAHFISHDLWTLSLCWFGALGLFILFKPRSWARPAGPQNHGGDSVQ